MQRGASPLPSNPYYGLWLAPHQPQNLTPNLATHLATRTRTICSKSPCQTQKIQNPTGALSLTTKPRNKPPSPALSPLSPSLQTPNHPHALNHPYPRRKTLTSPVTHSP